MKNIVLTTATLFITIQFIDVNSTRVNGNSIDRVEAPKDVLDILKRSCFDCHSNSTNYPWYDKIAPISWYVNRNINRGRDVLNFDEWNSYDREKRVEIADRLKKAIKIRMPLQEYLWLHGDAELSKEDKRVLNSWADKIIDN